MFFGNGLVMGSAFSRMTGAGARRQVLMPYWHGLFSLGAVVGALAGALAASLGLPLGWQLTVVSAGLMAAMWFATSRYLHDAGLHPAATQPIEEPIFDEPQVLACDREAISAVRRWPITQMEMLLGVMVFATAVGEGTANDWLALMLVDNRGAPPALGAVTYSGFNLTMTIGRFAGGAIIHGFGRVPVLHAARQIERSGTAKVSARATDSLGDNLKNIAAIRALLIASYIITRVLLGDPHRDIGRRQSKAADVQYR